MPIASHSEAGRGDSKLAKYLRQDQQSRCWCQPLYFILDKQKGASMSKIPELCFKGLTPQPPGWDWILLCLLFLTNSLLIVQFVFILISFLYTVYYNSLLFVKIHQKKKNKPKSITLNKWYIYRVLSEKPEPQCSQRTNNDPLTVRPTSPSWPITDLTPINHSNPNRRKNLLGPTLDSSWASFLCRECVCLCTCVCLCVSDTKLYSSIIKESTEAETDQQNGNVTTERQSWQKQIVEIEIRFEQFNWCATVILL